MRRMHKLKIKKRTHIEFHLLNEFIVVSHIIRMSTFIWKELVWNSIRQTIHHLFEHIYRVATHDHSVVFGIMIYLMNSWNVSFVGTRILNLISVFPFLTFVVDLLCSTIMRVGSQSLMNCSPCWCCCTIYTWFYHYILLHLFVFHLERTRRKPFMEK